MKKSNVKMNLKKFWTLSVVFLSAIGGLVYNPLVQADQSFNDDLIVKGSQCLGLDCAVGENFNYDTLRLKENNLRIRFIDTSATSSFTKRDWQITANDSLNGGLDHFSIENIDNQTVPFTILDGAQNASIYVSTAGRVGFGTTTPLMNLHVKSGNSPTLRLHQDTSGGFAEQAWDVGGNETNFFVRDVTGNGALPLRISSGATTGSIFVASDGDVGFETVTPDGQFDVAHSANSNNHAFLISPISYVGVNIDNGFLPKSLFDVQSTAGVSRFMVTSDGKIGVNMDASSTPNGLLDVQDTGHNSKLFVGTDGKVGIGTNAPATNLHVKTNDGAAKIKVEETNSTKAARALLELTNNGGVAIALQNSSTNETWYINHENTSPNDFIISNLAGVNGAAFRLTPDGDLTIAGSITTAGTTCGGGCDKVFTKEFQLESIEEHAELMWKNSYLPTVGPTIENEPFNLSEKIGRILNELEKAHIYIEHLNNKLKLKEIEMNEKLVKLEQELSKLSNQ